MLFDYCDNISSNGNPVAFNTLIACFILFY